MRNRKSPTLRFSAACKLIDLSLLRKRPGGAGDDDGTLLARLTQAVQLRERTLGAVDAEPIRADSVAPDVSPVSEQPDSKTE